MAASTVLDQLAPLINTRALVGNGYWYGVAYMIVRLVVVTIRTIVLPLLALFALVLRRPFSNTSLVDIH